MDYMGGSVPDTALLRLRFYFCYVKHSKNLNVPFPRPFGATGNDARKLHAHGFARFRGVLSAHEVFRLNFRQIFFPALFPACCDKFYSLP